MTDLTLTFKGEHKTFKFWKKLWTFTWTYLKRTYKTEYRINFVFDRRKNNNRDNFHCLLVDFNSEDLTFTLLLEQTEVQTWAFTL